MPQRNLLNRPLADGIRHQGFRKWYERELLSSHAHMTLAILAAVAMLAIFEAFQGASPFDKLVNTGFVVASAAIALWSLRRYLFLLMHAEELANQANCPGCQAYGQLRLQDEPAVRPKPGLVPVCCKRCGFRWTLQDD